MRETTKIIKKKREYASSKFRNRKQPIDQIDNWRQVSKMADNISEQNKIDFFNKNGYLIISDLFSNKEINDLINKVKSVFDISNLSEEEI